MKYLGMNVSDLNSLGGLNTAREISQQPQLWLKIWQMVHDQKGAIEEFLSKVARVNKVILTGAGTSAYIGESLSGSFFRHLHKCVQAVPSTDLVSHPHEYFSASQTILLVSFARSGNSPESKAAVSLADCLSKSCHHLVITCNGEGTLAKYSSKNGKFVFLLPSEANDKSLAMTSSYTGMLLAGLLISRLNEISSLKEQVRTVVSYGEGVLREYLTTLKTIAALPFKRAVFLGSGPQLGTATESHLKLQELTDGNIICKHDSFLGFRHGPKAIVDTETLIVYNFSNSDYVNKYEMDLVFAMEKGKKALAQVAVTEKMDFDLPLDYKIIFTDKRGHVDEEFLCLPGVIPAQVLSFFKSIHEGLSPDNPSKSGAISRVVEGVNIYELS